MTYFISCGNTEPHDHHAYDCDGEWLECAGIPDRTPED